MSWSVYKHTFPDGRVYIGITSLSPNERWDSGLGYESQPKFFRQIVKVGWDNIEHEVLASGLSEQSAREMEKNLIALAADKSLNTQHHRGVELGWLKDNFREDSSLVRHRKFSKFSDRWMEKVRYNNILPYRWDISEEYMELGYMVMQEQVLIESVLRVPIPSDMSYNELYGYFCYKLNFSKEYVVISQIEQEVSL
jgi:hypothetical protein